MGNEENSNTETVNAGIVEQSVTPQVDVTPQATAHTFTQEQLNSIISGRINPLNQKVAELSTQLAKAEKLTAQYHDELENYKRKEVVLKEGISADLVDYAIFGASKLVSKDKSFEDALKEFKAANATLFGGTQQASGSENGSTQTNNNGQQAQQQAQANKVQTVNVNSGNNVNSGDASVEEQVKQFLEKKKQSFRISK